MKDEPKKVLDNASEKVDSVGTDNSEQENTTDDNGEHLVHPLGDNTRTWLSFAGNTMQIIGKAIAELAKAAGKK